MLVLTRGEVERLLDLDRLIDALAAGFVAVSEGRVSMPLRTAAAAPDGLLGAMPYHLAGVGLGLKAVSVFPGNDGVRVPTHQGLLLLFDDRDGAPLCAMDAAAITAARTGAASALSVKILARRRTPVLAIIGAGVQGRSHLAAVPRVREFDTILIASRDRDRAAALARTHAAARAAASFEDAVRGADVVCCCTDAATPVLEYGWLEAGAHVTSVGMARDGCELDRDTLSAGRLFVESRAAFAPYPAGSPGLQDLDPQAAIELGEVASGLHPGRRNDRDITVYRSMGLAMEDGVAARLVYNRALESGAGTRVAI